jgi:hypothetical protein
MAAVPPASAFPATIPGILDCPSLNLLAGASGLGKTAFLSSVIATIRDQGRLFGEATHPPAAIGYVCTDRPWASAQQWFAVAGYPDVAHYSMIDDRKFDPKQLYGGKSGPGLLQHCVGHLKLPPGSLVIVDPIALFMGGRLNDYTTTSIACVEIQRWLIDAQLTMIGVCHTSKLKADVNDRYARPQDRILGSGALLGYSSTQMYLMGPDEAGRTDGAYTFLWNPHHRPAASFLLERDDTNGLFKLKTYRKHFEDSESAPEKPLSPEQEGLCNAILDLFPPYPETISTHALVLGTLTLCVRQTLMRYLNRLVALGKVHKSSRGRWQRVPTA